MARRVPASSSSWIGIVMFSFVPDAPMRRNLAWLPFWESSRKSNRLRIETTCLPESLRSLGDTRRGLKLQRHHEGGIGAEAQFLQVFTLEVEGDCFLQIFDGLSEEDGLSGDANLHASR